MNVRVRYTGKHPLVVQDKTWYEDEVHEIDDKLARAMFAFGDPIEVLPAAGEAAGGEAEADGAGEDSAGGDEAGAVVAADAEVAPKAKRKR